MRTFFSKRHEASILEKKMPLSFSKSVRISIMRTLDRFSVLGGYNSSENYTVESAVEVLKTFYGRAHLEAYNDAGKLVPANFQEVILNAYPGLVIDAIEAWLDQDNEQRDRCECELNDLLAINNSPWRFINGFAVLLDSAYLHREVQAQTVRLLRDSHALGAMEEFQSALQDLQAGDTNDAVVKAHKSVESVMKVVLGKSGHVTFGALLSGLIKSNILPKYYEEFLVHFEKLALGAVKERNQPGRGHGQGLSVEIVPRCLAVFAINLAGSINVFLIEHWIELKGHKSQAKVAQQPAMPADESMPF